MVDADYDCDSAIGNLLMSASAAVYLIDILFYKLLDDE
jgi:hypothetical protein